MSDTPRAAGDDFRSRFDGIERLGDHRIEALRRLDLDSLTTVTAIVRNGRPTALHGRFPVGGDDPVKAATAFLDKYAATFDLDLHGRDLAFAEPQVTTCDKAIGTGVKTVIFAHHVEGVPVYRAGIAVGIEGGGVVRSVLAHVPTRTQVRKGGDAAGARRVAAAFLGEGRLPEPTFELLDPALVFGEPGEPAGVWVFDVSGEAPIQVLVKDGAGEVFRVVENPGCPIGTVPAYHLNRVTGAPDLVLFRGGGLLLPEASSGNPVVVARAVFERHPKLFGTGDPTAQLALDDVVTSPDPQMPMTTVVFQQRWGGRSVFGCQLRVHLSKTLAVRSISGNFLRDPNVPATAAVTEASARITASTTAAFDTPVTLDRPHPAGPIRNPRVTASDPAVAPTAPLPFDAVLVDDTRPATLATVGFAEPMPADHVIPPSTDRDARAEALKLAADFHHASQFEPERASTMGVRGLDDRGLVILPTSLLRSGGGQNHLAWWFRSKTMDRFVSATTGTQVLALSRVQTAERVFDAANTNDPVAGAGVQVLDGAAQVPAANLDPDAIGAAGAVAGVAAFWRTLRRDSWDGRSGNMDAYVDWQALDDMKNPSVNAAWDGSRALFSPQLSVPDVVGHEFTHALTQSTAGLVYMDESGAANEHYSDLFGNLIFPDTAPGGWRVGEDIPTGAFRDMRNPAVRTYQNYLVAQPTQAGDFGGVHSNSGILNRAAVLLCDGDPPRRPTGIGRSRLARLAWETLVFRLHPFASFSDVMHLTWAVAHEFADAGARGAFGIPLGDVAADGLPPLFDVAVTDSVVWAFEQVGLRLDVQSGWHDVTVNTPFESVPGTPGFVADETLYPTPPTPLLTDGRTLVDMEVRLFRGVNGSMRASTGGVFNAPDGSYSARITSASGIGTANLQTQVRITSPTALSVQLSPVPTISNPTAGGPVTPPAQPPLADFDTPRVAHWLDVIPIGRDYDDTIYAGALLPVGCFVTNVELRVVGIPNISAPGGSFGDYLIASTSAVGVNVGEDHKGAHIVSRTLGGRSLEVKVHSWHHPWVAVRYVLRYTVAGVGATLPPFTIA